MRADNQHADLENRSEDRINQLDALLEKAIATVGVIGSTGMAGGYQIVANTEKKAADFWRWGGRACPARCNPRNHFCG
jgi:hypothetical protein